MDIMKATDKNPALDAFLLMVAGKDRVRTIADGDCMTCNSGAITPLSFKDDLSLKEYSISGMCQDCQDSVFDTEEE